jgi:hypothetical protein
MPLLRSRLDVRRSRLKFVQRLFAVMAIVTLLFIAIVGGHYLLGWW